MRCDARTQLFLYTFKPVGKGSVCLAEISHRSQHKKTFNNHTIDPHSIYVIRYSSTSTTAQLRVSRGVHPRSIFIKERHPAGKRVLLVQESVF